MKNDYLILIEQVTDVLLNEEGYSFDRKNPFASIEAEDDYDEELNTLKVPKTYTLVTSPNTEVTVDQNKANPLGNKRSSPEEQNKKQAETEERKRTLAAQRYQQNKPKIHGPNRESKKVWTPEEKARIAQAADERRQEKFRAKLAAMLGDM